VFGSGVREAHCVEYAHLFAATFETLASRAGVNATARVIHSSRATLFGITLPHRALTSHDWVLVTDAKGRKWLVDPTLHDVGAYYDVRWNVGA
jgi:hypothetical protein